MSHKSENFFSIQNRIKTFHHNCHWCCLFPPLLLLLLFYSFFCFHSNICVNSFALNWIQSSNDETMFRHFFSYFASSHSSLVLCGFFFKPFFWGRTKDWKNRDEHFKCWSLTRLLLFWRIYFYKFNFLNKKMKFKLKIC